MSWSELERLVAEAEASSELQKTLRRCRSRQQLLLCARRHGYRVTPNDLQHAWLEHRQGQPIGADADPFSSAVPGG
jgi:hypothetical protein